MDGEEPFLISLIFARQRTLQAHFLYPMSRFEQKKVFRRMNEGLLRIYKIIMHYCIFF